MKKNGFTLIEILGVIIVLSVISSIAVVTVDHNIKKGKVTVCLAQQANIIESAKSYFVDHPDKANRKVTISTLKNGGYLDKELKNPMTDESYSNNTYVLNDQGEYKITYVDEVDCNGAEGKTIEEIIANQPIIKRWTQINYGDGDYHAAAITPNIISADFVNLTDSVTAPTPNNTTSWDVSAAGNGTVIAWVTVDESDNTKYNLHIGGKDGVIANPETSNWLFAGLTGLVSVDFTNFDTTDTTSMYGMFHGCSSLTTVDLSQLDTSGVTNLGGMFHSCSSLTTVDLSSWDTRANTRLDHMFIDDSSLQTVIFGSNFDTSNVTTMASMFNGCSSLTTLDVSDWNTSKVTSMEWMFNSCSSLTALNVSKWNTSNVTDMYGVFQGCSGLTTLNVSNWNTSKVTDMHNIFRNCPNLATLDVSNWNVSKVTDMSSMFAAGNSIVSLDLSRWNTSNVTNMNAMFSAWKDGAWANRATTSLTLGPGWDTSKVTTMKDMFSGLLVTTLDLSSFDTSSVTTMYHMFNACPNLTTVYASDAFVTTALTDDGGTGLFTGASNLVGGKGTAVATKKVYDKTYAKVDKTGQEGYFTKKA